MESMTGNRLDDSDSHNILLRSTNWVGDAVLTTPAIRAVRKNFPNASVTILAKPWVAPVFFKNPYIDGILCYDSKGLHRGVFGILRLSRTLRHFKFDLAILFQNAFEAALITYLGGVSRRLGYNTDGRGVLLTHPVSIKPHHKRIHETEYYLEILKGGGLQTDGTDLTLILTNEERTLANQIFKKTFGDGSARVLGIGPGAVYGSAKRWPPERFAALSNQLYRSHQTRTLIFGSPNEKAIGEQVRRAIVGPALNLCGATDLRQAAALMERCNLFVTNDSGLMHVAAALDIQMIAIFGSTNPVTTGPLGAQSRVVQAPVSCSPCLKPDCPTDHRCMTRIKVDTVYETAVDILNDTASTQHHDLATGTARKCGYSPH